MALFATALITAQEALGAAATVTEQLNVPLFPAESVTVTVYGKVPVTVGVPDMTPPVDIVSPAGRPVAEKVYGPPAPPVPVRVTGAMALFCTALITAQEALGAAATVTEQLNVPLFPAESVTVTV
jgi:hypothetical protein